MSVTDRDHEIIRLAFAMEIPPAEQKEAAAPPDPVKPELLMTTAGDPVAEQRQPPGELHSLIRGREAKLSPRPKTKKSDIVKKGEPLVDGLTSVVDVEVERISVDEAKAAVEALVKDAGILAGIGRTLPFLPRLGAKMTGVAGRGMRELARNPAISRSLPELGSVGSKLALKSRLAPIFSKISPDVLRQMTGVGLGTVGAGAAGATGTAALLKTLLSRGSPVKSTKKEQPDKSEKEAADAQNAKKKETESETPPGVVRLESASDTPPKKAPAKKPESKSENEATKQVRAGGQKTAAVDPSALAAAAERLRGAGMAREERLKALPTIGGAAAGGAGGYGLLKLLRAARQLATKYPQFGRVIGKLAPYAGAGLGAAGAGLGGYLAIQQQLKKPTVEVGPEVLEQLAGQLGPKAAGYTSVPSDAMGLPVRGDQQRATNRDSVFRELARWSAGKDHDEKSISAA